MAHKLNVSVVENTMRRFAKVNGNVDMAQQIITVPSPGLPYACLGLTGIPSVWELIKFLETTRLVGQQPGLHIIPTVEDLFPSDHDNIVLTVPTQRLSLSKSFYKKAALKMPMNYTIARGYQGKTSIGIINCLQDVETGQTLVQQELALVYLDIQSRKTLTVPDNIKRFYPKRTQPFHIRVMTPPDTAHCYKLYVTHSDMDRNRHTSGSSYLRFCMDAAADAITSGKLKNFGDEMFPCEVKHVDAIYQGESFAGEELTIFTWEDRDHPHTMHCQIDKHTKHVMFATFQFFNPHQHKL